MNVLHLNQSDLAGGGAAIAGYRLHQGLLAAGIDSNLLVGTATIDHSRINRIPRQPFLEDKLYRLTSRLGLNYLNVVSSFGIPNYPSYQAADILNFHNLHTGYFNYLAIPVLTKPKPAVYTLHDMWSFTGHCAYSYDCDRWQTGCGSCPYPSVYPEILRDNTALEWKLKNWLYQRSDLTIVALSQWLTDRVQQSMLNRFPIHTIPNGIDTQAYQPLDPQQCRAVLGLPAGKRVLLFGAQKLKDTRKGGDLLVKALQCLPDSLKQEIVLLTLGESGAEIADMVGMPTLDLGYVNSDRLKSIAYSAADLFVFPTRADNVPLVLQESMACGTPMVSFKVGGVPDLVRPGVTGYLATPENTTDFCDGIVQLLEDHALRAQMSHHCREIALREYPLELQAQRYIELYQQILAKG
ncbi:glycosyltransferase family 4 protein [Kovacikia minuta CCNUW1]|uniref:glycosyltransferase family 4 protein n=1 Tax=Kovacikia minuta TaxID=2931930 RepID=UPI001CCC22A4|nr:glycosyltransferase family 4 protein [Kovacikia minuta]UBF27346.1 glycosyltransferase family 4 protein [Kovacikia minuta CCNUW1]